MGWLRRLSFAASVALSSSTLVWSACAAPSSARVSAAGPRPDSGLIHLRVSNRGHADVVVYL